MLQDLILEKSRPERFYEKYVHFRLLETETGCYRNTFLTLSLVLKYSDSSLVQLQCEILIQCKLIAFFFSSQYLVVLISSF